MGNAKRRSMAFLRMHPYCCFCGGQTLATTRDHWPSRALFDSRQSPEGYEFPACEACNRLSSQSEAIFVMFCRLVRPMVNGQFDSQTDRLIRALAEQHPELSQSLISRPIEVRRYLREKGLTLNAGTTTHGLGLVNLEHPDIGKAFETYFLKLALALHYKHTASILSQGGGVSLNVWSNADSAKEVPTEAFGPYLKARASLTRQKVDLSGQFVYEWNADTTTGTVSLFWIIFPGAFAALASVAADRQTLVKHLPANSVFPPFSPHPQVPR